MIDKKYKNNNNTSYTVHIRLTSNEYENLKKAAAEDTRTISNLCYKVLKGVLGL